MRSLFFKAALAIAIALLFLCSSAKAQVQDNDGCSNATLKGDYAVTVSGQFYLPSGVTVLREGVAMAHYDGMGNFTQVDLVLSSPNAPPPPGVSPTDPISGFHNEEKGTYKVNADCTGTFTINFPELTNPSTGAMTPGAVIVAGFVLSDHGRAIHAIVTSLTPPGAPGPVPALIHSESYKLDRKP
jgi:hypothetical protein